MLPYYKKYSIITCIIAVVPTLVLTYIWPLLTGQVLFASITGLLAAFGLFFLSLWIGFILMERKAETETDQLLAFYNNYCDPKALVEKGSKLASAIAFPCKDPGAWFMGYYGQALLDCGEIDRAKEVEKGLEQSVLAAKSDASKCGILVNLVPLAEKLEGTEITLKLVAEGLELTKGDTSAAGNQRHEYLLSQQKLLEERNLGNSGNVAKLDRSIRTSEAYPMRVRVEAAWNEAHAANRMGDTAQEKESLMFVSQHGNKLALTSQAIARLNAIS